ncbi:MAG: hypothetical protein ACRDOH_02675 [Streptosporangiaceae bacterium]
MVEAGIQRLATLMLEFGILGRKTAQKPSGGPWSNRWSAPALDSSFRCEISRLTYLPRVIWFLLWLAATLAAVAVGGTVLVMPS